MTSQTGFAKNLLKGNLKEWGNYCFLWHCKQQLLYQIPVSHGRSRSNVYPARSERSANVGVLLY